ncbi:DUF4197 domain-containing protein [Caldimonas brevitalea]|uniref:DUF4197 domain-containing protein n=1 Tax=Caldimonas brevitalea TaxID=413882 RepID=UPI000ACF82A2|nr:DUF4197 domain-containing protein [Caldimonas brevitalea]
MDRRKFTGRLGVLAASTLLGAPASTWALSLSDLSERDATLGLKTALERGAVTAVNLLGRTDGFLGNPKVRIPLPEHLQDAADLLRSIGQAQRLDELETAMNRAAEAAVPEARSLLVGAVKQMSVSDAKQILRGSDTSVTEFFSGKTREPLGQRFLPIVAATTDKVGLARRYNKLVDRAAAFGLVSSDVRIEPYVTGKALDGLFFMIAEEERQIRRDPIGTGSAILRKVFGAL